MSKEDQYRADYFYNDILKATSPPIRYNMEVLLTVLKTAMQRKK